MNLVCLFIYFFAFYTEIQDRCQKWQENDFCKKSPADSADTLRVKNFVEIALSHSRFRDKRIFVLDTEIQDDRQKWWEIENLTRNRPPC